MADALTSEKQRILIFSSNEEGSYEENEGLASYDGRTLALLLRAWSQVETSGRIDPTFVPVSFSLASSTGKRDLETKLGQEGKKILSPRVSLTIQRLGVTCI